MFFEDFFGITDSAREVAVCCPFPHRTLNGLPYLEARPSAHINTQDRVFHCMACGAGHSETSFVQAVLNCSFLDAKKLLRCFTNNEDKAQWEQDTTLSEEGLQQILALGISTEVVEELRIKVTDTTHSILFPVFMYDHLCDIRKYNPGERPKVRSRAGSPSSLIMPFDLWRTTPKTRITLVCAGEKDMAVARSHGFNAITLTGGEQTPPKFLAEFQDRKVAIVYDNDEAGLSGARKVAQRLYQVTNQIKLVTSFHEVCHEHGEDITDFFVKYGKSKADLIGYIEATETYVPSADELEQCYPMIDLLTASKPEHVIKLVRSNIQVVSVSEASFITPTAIIAEKFRLSSTNDTMQEHATKEWELQDENIQDLLHLVDNNFKEETINNNIRALLRIPLKEKYVSVKHYSKKPVYKAYVTDLFETNSSDVTPMEYTAYSVNAKLESGKKYLVTYKLVPHPYKGQQLTMLITNVVQANDSVSNFNVNDDVIHHLRHVQEIPGTTSEKIETLTEKFKGVLGYNGNNTLIQAMDLAYHTVLQFDFGSFKAVRGYLDTIIVGESRMGKSSTATAMQNLYGLGVFTSLAGNSATIPGLIGGSNKVNGTYQTRAGVIPQNHKGLIIFEEFGKSNNNIVKELTDIRSSNEVRIARVSGTITMPALVRMITLTNVKSADGNIKPIAAYPNGITIITELIGTAEDIARYDLMVVLSDRGSSQIDPMWEPQTPLPKEVYQTRLRWIWSRVPDQIIIDREVGLYIMEQANALNREYDCHIKIFGTEAWKKICRLAIAVAGYVVSSDESFQNIVVLKEHVDYAITFFKLLYDNQTFKLKEYVQHERQFAEIDEEGVALLQDVYMKHPTLVLQLEQCSQTSKNMLGAATGLDNDALNKALTILMRGLFIRFSNHDIVPTERFRLGVARLQRDTRVLRVGEHNA